MLMNSTKEQVLQEWREEVEGMTAQAHLLPHVHHERRALNDLMADWGYTPFHSLDSYSFAQFYNRKTGRALMVHENPRLEGLNLWNDDVLSNEEFVLVRHNAGEHGGTSVHLTYLVPSLALYDVGVKHGLRTKSYLYAYDEPYEGHFDTMELLINNGIAVSLGAFATNEL